MAEESCPACEAPMRWERAHYTCDVCHQVQVTCCEGAPSQGGFAGAAGGVCGEPLSRPGEGGSVH